MNLAMTNGLLCSSNIIAQNNRSLDVYILQVAYSTDEIEMSKIETFSRSLIASGCIEVLIQSSSTRTHQGSLSIGYRVEYRIIERIALIALRQVVDELLIVLHLLQAKSLHHALLTGNLLYTGSNEILGGILRRIRDDIIGRSRIVAVLILIACITTRWIETQ